MGQGAGKVWVRVVVGGGVGTGGGTNQLVLVVLGWKGEEGWVGRGQGGMTGEGRWGRQGGWTGGGHPRRALRHPHPYHDDYNTNPFPSRKRTISR